MYNRIIQEKSKNIPIKQNLYTRQELKQNNPINFSPPNEFLLKLKYRSSAYGLNAVNSITTNKCM